MQEREAKVRSTGVKGMRRVGMIETDILKGIMTDIKIETRTKVETETGRRRGTRTGMAMPEGGNALIAGYLT